jgi:chorismate synthase
MNSIGKIFRLTEFGESHGHAIGGVIDGVPSNFHLDMENLRRKVAQRRPGASPLTSPRRESDSVEFLSGLKGDTTLGTPIGFIVRNEDARSEDYEALANAYRPNHADYTYQCRYGIRDHRGGGRASARTTIPRVVAGAIALQILKTMGVEVRAFISQIGDVALEEPYARFPEEEEIFDSPVRCHDAECSAAMESLVRGCVGKDSIGGRVSVIIRGVPAGVGNPVYGKIQSLLAAAMMSINAARGVEFGDGFASAAAYGTEVIDRFTPNGDGTLATETNHSGGLQGGITNGSDITLSVAFKPTPTLPIPLATYDNAGNPVILPARGRHDPCVAIRAVSVVEAMAAFTILDALLLHNASKGIC